MKNHKPTLTIGIPAYNEEANIKTLIVSLLGQKRGKFTLKKIIVNSDASSDKTVSRTKSVKSSLIKIIENKKRKGKAYCLNIITKHTNNDILVFIDADVLIKDKHFIEKLIWPIASGKADLTSAKVDEIEPTNLLEKILENSMKIKKEIFESYNFGDNVYTCHGRSLALSKNLYSSFVYKPGIAAEDAYLYLYAKSHSFKYAFVKKAVIYYKLPGTFTDHQKQSIRFLQSKKNYASEYRLPTSLVLKSFLKGFFVHPILTVLYISLLASMEIKSLFINNSKPKWEIAKSSKVLIKRS